MPENTLKFHYGIDSLTLPRINKLTLSFTRNDAPMFETKSGRAKTKTASSPEAKPRELRSDQAILLVSASEGEANMLYATGFSVPDPFIFFQHKKTKYVVMSDLEVDRAKKQARVDRVLSLSQYQKKLRRAGKASRGMTDILDLLFGERATRSLFVPATLSALQTDQLTT